jgi:hypothetical protein
MPWCGHAQRVIEEVVEEEAFRARGEADVVVEDARARSLVAAALDEIAVAPHALPRRPAEHVRAPDRRFLDVGLGVRPPRGHEAVVVQEAERLAEGDEVVAGEDAADADAVDRLLDGVAEAVDVADADERRRQEIVHGSACVGDRARPNVPPAG